VALKRFYRAAETASRIMIVVRIETGASNQLQQQCLSAVDRVVSHRWENPKKLKDVGLTTMIIIRVGKGAYRSDFRVVAALKTGFDIGAL
jgi:hypothetical protein